jgi:hypothetical protein
MRDRTGERPSGPTPLFPEAGVTRDEFWAFKKEMQEKQAAMDKAEELRDKFSEERRWYIGTIIALAAICAGLAGYIVH